MRHIFKKLHFGGGSGSDSSSSASSSSSTAAPPPPSSPSPSLTCGPSAPADLRQNHHPSAADPIITSPSPSMSPTSPVVDPAPVPVPRLLHAQDDYFSSEEDYQMQLALAISASNSDFREDPHNDQIRAATLLSLGKHRNRRDEEIDDTAESLSRRYWDYNVLDYDEKVVDGFYDIFALSADPAGHGKMPLLSDLQTNIGDLGFEVILVNRAIDRSLQELEQITQCISLDCPRADIGILVQRIADLVTEHMGGPVRDANDMLARWMERSTSLRTSLQTSLLPIGGVNVGLSRHRALLFKVLADKVGIPCKLVKGSHYTGVDDDAVNIVKDHDREFLVDLMAAPGILIPVDVPSTKKSSTTINSGLSKSSHSWEKDDSSSTVSMTKSHAEYNRGDGKSDKEGSGNLDTKTIFEKPVLTSFPSSSSGSLPSSSGSCFDLDKRIPFIDEQCNRPLDANYENSVHKDNLDMSVSCDYVKEKHNAYGNLQDSKDLFAELNPFQAIEVGKVSTQFKTTEKRMNGFQRRRENISSGPGRPPLPLVWKNRPACNEVPNKKLNDFSEGLFPRKNMESNDFNVLSSSSSRKIHPENSKISAAHISGALHSPGMVAASNEQNNSTGGNFAGYSPCADEIPSKTSEYIMSASDHENTRADKPLVSVQSSQDTYQETDGTHMMVSQANFTFEPMEHGKVVGDKHERRKYTHDRFMGTNLILRDFDSHGASAQARPDRLDPMLDDVAELEIPWEDLVIGERIGLGSYGEVYHADWNGTEVAVKKFLDQDFYGDALDEFRSEVRIMRRLRHPNVVLFMGAVTRPPNLSIVTEFLPRGSLYRILHRPNCQIDQKRRIKMALDVAKGMNCLHTSTPTIVHRDLKSPNLLVDKNWNVKVCDFGLSRLKHNTFLSSKSTAGTPEWMAPEVLRNEQSNEKCDVYSFGVILWELATLRMPWSGMNPMQVVGAVGFQNRRLDIPKELDPLVARIIWECWQTDSSLRPSFAELTSTLKPLQQLVIPFHEDMQSPSLPTEISVNSTP